MDGRGGQALKRARAGRSLVALLVGCLLAAAVQATPSIGRADGAGPTESHGPPPTVRLFAAASLTDAAVEIAGAFAAGRVELTTGSSSLLARQIADGAPADVFFSASRDWMDYLADHGALAGPPTVLARGALVCVVPTQAVISATTPETLAASLAADDVVAIADPGVPAGEYARAALANEGIVDVLGARLVGLANVRAVLRAVEQGEAAAGFVYATDSTVADVRVLFAFDADAHPPIEYMAAVIRGSRVPDVAHALVELAAGERGGAIFRAAGFRSP